MDMRLCLCKRLNELGQLLGSLQGNRVVVARPDAANAAVPLETSQVLVRGLLEECLFRLIDVAILDGC